MNSSGPNTNPIASFTSKLYDDDDDDGGVDDEMDTTVVSKSVFR